MSSVSVNFPLNTVITDTDVVNMIRQTYPRVWTCSTYAFEGETPFPTYGLYDTFTSVLPLINKIPYVGYTIQHPTNPVKLELKIAIGAGMHGKSYYTFYGMNSEDLRAFNAAFPQEESL